MNTLDNRHHILRYFFGLILFCVFFSGMIACTEQRKSIPESREKITIAYPSMNPLYALPYIALKKNFFADEALDVTLQPHDFGKLAIQSIPDGKADLALSANTPFMFLITSGLKVRMLAVLASSELNIGIVADKKRGIASPADLKGKKIGVPFGTSTHFFLDLFLSTRQINKNDVILMDVKPREISDALTDNRVDAVAIWNVILTDLKTTLGDNAIVFYDKDIFKDYVCLSTSPEFIAQRPETVKKVLKAFIRTEKFVKENADESRMLVSTSMKTGTNIPVELWNSYHFRLTLERSLIADLEDQTRWMIKKGIINISELPDYKTFIYTDALKSLKSDAVSIVQ